MVSNVYQKVQVLMARQGLTLTQLATKAGMVRQSIYQLKKAKHHRLTTIHKLAKALDTPVEHFFE